MFTIGMSHGTDLVLLAQDEETLFVYGEKPLTPVKFQTSKDAASSLWAKQNGEYGIVFREFCVMPVPLAQ